MESEGSEEGDDKKLSGGEGSGSDDQYFSADENVDTDSGTRGASVHHHHYHDRRVQIHGSVGIVVSGDGNSGNMQATVGTCQNLMKTQDVISNELDDWTRGMVETSALRKVMEMLKKGTTWITIKGSPGEGKTTVAKMALRQLQKSGRQVFQSRSPTEFKEATRNCSGPTIMLDDILGDLEFDQTAWLKWKDVFHEVLDKIEHRSHEQQTKLSEKEEVTVIFVGRDYVLNSLSVHTGKLQKYIFLDSHVVDMTHSVERSLDEKKNIWDAIVGPSGIDVPHDSMWRIFQLCGQHGFPHVCRLFVTLHVENPKISAENFFETPLEFLNQTVESFLENEFKLHLFKEMIARQGKVTERDLQDSNYKVIKTAKDLTGTYLRMEDGYVVFDHPSVYDSVAFNLSKYHTLFVIKKCKLSFVHERLRLEPPRGPASGPLRSDTNLVMYISQSYATDLAKRFADELSKRNLLLVLSHQACTQEMFIEQMMSQLSVSLTEFVQMMDNDSGEICFSLLASNKCPHLLMYINRRTDIALRYVVNWNDKDPCTSLPVTYHDEHNKIQLTLRGIDMILYGVCKYAASDVLTYLNQTTQPLDINVKFGAKQTPLMIAAETRDSRLVHQIMSLNPRPDLNACDRFDRSTLHYLCANGLVSAVKETIDRGIDVNVTNWHYSPLYCACCNNHEEVINLLLDNGARIDSEVVEVECKRGNVVRATKLFKKGASVNMKGRRGNTPIKSACLGGHVEMIQYLIHNGASVNSADGERSPLHEAAFYSKPHVVEYLLEHGAVINRGERNGYTPLHRAAENGSVKCIDVLLKACADVNVQGKDGYTPLHKAAGRGSSECIDVLLKAYADVNVRGKDGYTPLHIAAGRRSEECVEVLLTAGACVNIQSEYGHTPLHTALYHNLGNIIYLPDISVCQSLIRCEADVNKQDAEGNTPLHVLCIVDSVSEVAYRFDYQLAYVYEDVYRTLVTLLIKHGADVDILNNEGESALRGWCQYLVDI